MNEIPLETFAEAIRATHGAEAELALREWVTETFEGETVWTGEVLTFDLQGHPSAHRCYAWEVDGRVTAVLGVGPIDSPLMAVRAAIMEETEAN